MWAATGDPETAAELGRRGMVNALVLRGMDGTKRAWAAYRQARVAAGLPAPGLDRFAYTAFVYVGDTDEEGINVGSKLLWFLNTSLKQAPQYSKFLPGRTPPELAPRIYRTGAQAAARPADALVGMTAEQAIAQKLMFAGRPETVYRQIMDCQAELGGFGHLIFIGRSGFMTHAEAEKSIRLFGTEVLPRLQEATPAGVA
jgi:alkanesulfonate monooxygenase SsuD/methylene tetrahydromethanopterin reductase-like flavin-dependent oxidoreductase (luciferase family)